MDCCLGWHKSLSQPTSFLRRLLPHVLLKKQLHQRQAQRRYTENRVKEKKTRENLIFLCLPLLIRVCMLLSAGVIVLSYSKTVKENERARERERERKYTCYFIENGINSSIRDFVWIDWMLILRIFVWYHWFVNRWEGERQTFRCYFVGLSV